ncbi:hypothetical protein HGB07_09100 [Candidatus Roizmanbacteria bacterium]|nr:hypothetical protein [Candidatus Roizmanbacteria bacterium]
MKKISISLELFNALLGFVKQQPWIVSNDLVVAMSAAAQEYNDANKPKEPNEPKNP